MVSDTVGPWRVLLSHTSELRDFPAGFSFVAAAERAVGAAGHAVIDMVGFPSANVTPADLCVERVNRCDVYVGILGTRYGSPVEGRPEQSYTQLEFEVATQAKKDRLLFVLDENALDVGIPIAQLIDLEYGDRQAEFRKRVQSDAGLTVQRFANPDQLQNLIERSLRALEVSRLAMPSGIKALNKTQGVLFARSALRHLRLMHSADCRGDVNERNDEKWYLGEELPPWDQLESPETRALRDAVRGIVEDADYDNDKVVEATEAIERWGGFGTGSDE